MPVLIKLQHFPITARQWHHKWSQRLAWYRGQQWTVPPRVVLVDLTGQTPETVAPPRNIIRVTRIEDVPKAQMRLSMSKRDPAIMVEPANQ